MGGDLGQKKRDKNRGDNHLKSKSRSIRLIRRGGIKIWWNSKTGVIPAQICTGCVAGERPR